MPKKLALDCVHKRAPTELVSALLDAGSERELSRRLKINVSYISNLVRRGIEPTDQTENGRTLRVKLFLTERKQKQRVMKRKMLLPKRKRKPRNAKPVDEHTKTMRRKINRMARETRKALKVTP